MGRRTLTAEQRVEAMNPEARVGLEVAKAAVERAADEVDAAAQLRASAINKAVELGESYRDIAAVLGVPHTTVHHFVKPYERKPAA